MRISSCASGSIRGSSSTRRTARSPPSTRNTPVSICRRFRYSELAPAAPFGRRHRRLTEEIGRELRLPVQRGVGPFPGTAGRGIADHPALRFGDGAGAVPRSALRLWQIGGTAVGALAGLGLYRADPQYAVPGADLHLLLLAAGDRAAAHGEHRG